VLTLLGAHSAHLPAAFDRRIVYWIGNNPAGIGYLGTDLQNPEPFHIFHWLESLEFLSPFQFWREGASGAMQSLWVQRKDNGLWDLGQRLANRSIFHFRMIGGRRATCPWIIPHGRWLC
jgi:hypothetical protein